MNWRPLQSRCFPQWKMEGDARPWISLLALCCWAASWQTASSVPTRTPGEILPEYSWFDAENAENGSVPSSGQLVPLPTNLVMESYNFNTTLYWDYHTTSFTPRFTVEIRFYISAEISVVETCRNIIEHFCDLSQNVKNPKDHYWGRVKAIIGAEESSYAESAPLYLLEDGKIGPPTLHVSVDDGKVLIDVYHPPTPFKNLSLLDIYEDFTYILYFGNKKIEFDEDECDREACSTEIEPAEKDSTLCISAEGISDQWMGTGERSEEKCLDIINIEAKKDHGYGIALILGLSFLAVILTILAVWIVFKILQDRNIRLPKSLAFLALHHGTPTEGSDNQRTLEQVSPVFVVERAPLISNSPKIPAQPELPIKMDISQNATVNSDTSVPHENEEPFDGYAASNLASSSNGKDKYFQSDSSSTEVERSTGNPGPRLAYFKVDPLEAPSGNVVSQSFGYDRCHAPLTLSTDCEEGR